MKHGGWVYALVWGIFASSCASTGSQQEHVILDEYVRQAHANLSQSQSQARSPLRFDNQETAKDCLSYMRLSQQHSLVETLENQLIKSEYLICDALDILLTSSAAKTLADTSSMGQALLNKLDLRSFPNAFSRLADDKAFTFSMLFPDNASANGYTATFDSDDWVITLHVVAVVDANGNADNDWVLHLADESKTGTYKNYQTLLIYDPLRSQVFKAHTYP